MLQEKEQNQPLEKKSKEDLNLKERESTKDESESTYEQLKGELSDEELEQISGGC